MLILKCDRGKNQTYPGNNFGYHLIPFKAAIAAGARQIMPYYSRPIGTQYPEVAFAFNKPIITGLLREELGFQGIVVSDWYLITDHVLSGEALPARAWGVEYLSELERTQGVLDAGCDQFGGEVRPELLVQLVNEGKISEKSESSRGVVPRLRDEINPQRQMLTRRRARLLRTQASEREVSPRTL